MTKTEGGGEDPATSIPRPNQPSGGAVRRRAEAVRHRYAGSTADTVWTRLSALDFINQAMLFAAILLLCFLPFMIVIGALSGRNVVTGLSRELGLNQAASRLVGQLFNPSATVSSTVTIRGIIFAIFGGIGTAATLQSIYERLYGLTSRGMKDVHRQLVWIAAVVGVAALVGTMGRSLRGVAAGPVLLALVGLALVAVFWFFSLWLLVGNRIPWRRFVAPAVATGICWVGLGIFSKFFFSKTVIGDAHEYGPIGVVFALMSWLIAVGVVIILGAVIGTVWSERDLSITGALIRLLRSRRRRTA